jgi:hypothetical protein
LVPLSAQLSGNRSVSSLVPQSAQLSGNRSVPPLVPQSAQLSVYQSARLSERGLEMLSVLLLVQKLEIPWVHLLVQKSAHL